MKLYASKRVNAAQILPDKRYVRLAEDIAKSADNAKQECRIEPYTLKAQTNSSRVLVYLGNVHIASFIYSLRTLDMYTYLSINFYWGDAQDLAEILCAVLKKGSIFNQQYSGLISDEKVTASTFNAYNEVLKEPTSKGRAFIFDNIEQQYIKLNSPKPWYALSRTHAKYSRFQLLILRPGYSGHLTYIEDVEFLAKLAESMKRAKTSSGNRQLKLFMLIPNSKIQTQDWDVLNAQHSEQRVLSQKPGLIGCMFENAAAPNLDTILGKMRKYERDNAPDDIKKMFNASKGFMYARAAKSKGVAVTLIFFSLQVGNSTLIIRHFSAQNTKTAV